MSNSNRPTLRVDQLVVGSTSRVSLADITGRQLIPSGAIITLALIEEIRQEGVTLLQVMSDVAGEVETIQATTSSPRETEASGIDARRLQPYSAERVKQLERKFAS